MQIMIKTSKVVGEKSSQHLCLIMTQTLKVEQAARYLLTQNGFQIIIIAQRKPYHLFYI